MTETTINKTPERHPTYDDEISLVDLAATVIRRRHAFYLVFLTTLVAAFVYLLVNSNEPVIRYTTVIQPAVLPVISEGDQHLPSHERVTTLLAIIESRWIPKAKDLYQEAYGQPMGARISAESVEGTELIRLVSGTTAGDEVVQAHQQLTTLIVENQDQQLKRWSSFLSGQIDVLDKIIDSYGPNSLVAAQAIETRATLEQKRAAGEQAEVLAQAQASSVIDGPSAKVVLIISVLLGLVLGILAAFMAEFLVQVRQSLATESHA